MLAHRLDPDEIEPDPSVWVGFIEVLSRQVVPQYNLAWYGNTRCHYPLLGQSCLHEPRASPPSQRRGKGHE